jgi:hypothetical protein
VKQQISPGVVIAVIVVILAGVGFFLFKGTGGGGTLPTGTNAPGNSSPFDPGGKANTEFGASKKGGN